MPHGLRRILIYAALIVWTVIALFPIYLDVHHHLQGARRT